jgi:predicted transcriptional regulator
VERLCKLLFELSSSRRMSILLEIQKQRLKLSQISKKLGMTVTETFRHLQRLSEVKLIQKDIDGSFHLTPFGELTLSLLSGLIFVSKHRDYFMEHDVSHIPHEFINRIGELWAGILGTDVMSGFRTAEIMLQEAQEYMWILSDQILMSTVPIIEERVKSGLESRGILPENLIPPPGFKPPKFNKVPIRMHQLRSIPKVEAIIVMTEREAMFCLPDLRRKMDYIAFISKDPIFHKWCKDLYLYYWEKAKPITSLIPRAS